MSLRSLQIGGGGGLQAATLLTELLLMLSRRSKRAFNLPLCLPGIEQATALKILGVTINLLQSCLRANTSATSSTSVHSRYTSSEFCAAVA